VRVCTINTRFTSPADLLTALLPLVDDTTLLLPASIGLATGDVIRFRILLQTGSVGYAGSGEVLCEVREGADSRTAVRGIRLRILHIDPTSRPLHDQLKARRRQASSVALKSDLTQTLRGLAPTAIPPPTPPAALIPATRRRSTSGAHDVFEGRQALGSTQKPYNPFADVSNTALGLLVEGTLGEPTVEMAMPDDAFGEPPTRECALVAAEPSLAPSGSPGEPEATETAALEPIPEALPDPPLTPTAPPAQPSPAVEPVWEPPPGFSVYPPMRARPPYRRALGVAAIAGGGLTIFLFVRPHPQLPVAAPPPPPVAAALPPAPVSLTAPLPARPAAGEAVTEGRPCEARIDSQPDGAKVMIGRRVLGRTPLEQVPVPCGQTRIRILHPRYEPRIETLLASADAPASISSRLVRPRAVLQLSSVPRGAMFRINGNPVGRAPRTASVPRYETIRVDASLGGRTWKRSFYVKAKSSALSASFKAAPDRPARRQ
jgi:hypothetical protein